jgi:hypothetical protein
MARASLSAGNAGQQAVIRPVDEIAPQAGPQAGEHDEVGQAPVVGLADVCAV